LYPSKTQEKELNAYLLACKDLWNSLIEYAKEQYDKTGKLQTRQALYAKTKGIPIFSQAAQNVADRLYKSIRGMQSRKNAGLKAGFPRFKPIERVKSFTYPQFGFSLNNELELSGIGSINIRKHRGIEGKIKTLTIKKSSSGKWFAIFTSEMEKTQKKIEEKPAVAVDLGIEHFAYLSDGNVIQNLRHLKKVEQKLKEAYRLLSKKKKGSRNRQKAKHTLAVAYEKLVNRRTDFLHKSSTMLANSYSLIAMENLGVSKMSRSFLAKSILDCAWAEFTRMLAYKAEEAGCELVLVNPAGTTQECSRCGSIKKKTLAERWHSCACGASMHRDLNAAINILKRATAGTAECQACGEGAPTLSIKSASTRNEAGSSAL
jgi:putative transposase